jgi:SAM-dependent methyltransferase
MALAHRLAWPAAPVLVAALLVPVGVAWWVVGWRRRAITVLGVPLSWLMLGMTVPTWAWLACLLPMVVAYPLRAWRDAPYFPSPPNALADLPQHIHLPKSPRVLDAGCGAGHGLGALQRAWPDARLHGVEWSWALAWWTRWRLRAATVRRGDMWADDWRDYDLVYVFQRPESMSRVWAKACEQMRPGSWLVSLEFTVPDVAPTLSCHVAGQRPVHAWCIVHGAQAQGRKPEADNHPSRRPFRMANKPKTAKASCSSSLVGSSRSVASSASTSSTAATWASS